MALDVELAAPGEAGSPFLLQATSVTIIYDRAPIAAPLPGTNPLLLDLGQFKTGINVVGIISEADTNLTDGGNAIADKDDLENAVKNWWDRTITFTVSSDAYTVKIQACNFELQAATESKWNFVLRLVGFLN